MALLNLWHSSCQADDGCLVYCSSQANLLLGSTSCKLFRITTAAGHTHIVWREAPEDYEYQFPAACRAFIEEDHILNDDIFTIIDKQMLIPEQDIFCVNGYVYYLHRTRGNNLVIRRINIYSSQKIVEQIVAEDFEDEVPESIYLSHFFEMRDNRREYVMTCWGVSFDENYLYIPIFDEDRHFIHECSPTSFIREEIPLGTIFKVRNQYYQNAVDEQGKIYLNHADNIFAFNKHLPTLSPKHHPVCINMKTIQKN